MRLSAKPSQFPASLLVLVGLCGAAPALAQPRGDSVAWTAEASVAEVKAGAKVALTLKGDVQPGWHVYGLKQLANGPTPLVVGLDKNAVATAAGAATASAPIKHVDPAFGLETQFYEKDFTVTAPVKIDAKTSAGRQLIPVSVRFQTCNGDICQPPKTVKLSVPINVKAAG